MTKKEEIELLWNLIIKLEERIIELEKVVVQLNAYTSALVIPSDSYYLEHG